MKKIVITNRKGGVGKTTTCILILLGILSRKGLKVLVIDTDGQQDLKKVLALLM